MRKPRWYDWVGAFGLWSAANFGVTVGLAESGAPEEVVLPLFLTIWAAGLVTARIWWLRRGGSGEAEERSGLTTGEMMAQRLELMEQRIYELEERLELTERMLLQAEQRERLGTVRGELRP